MKPILTFVTVALLVVCVRSPENSGQALAAEPYEGPMFDGHSHLSGRSNPGEAYRHIVEGGFGKAALFVDINQLDKVASFSQDAFVVFADPFE